MTQNTEPLPDALLAEIARVKEIGRIHRKAAELADYYCKEAEKVLAEGNNAEQMKWFCKLHIIKP